MALIRGFVANNSVVGGVHRTNVDCHWKAFEAGGARILQLDTFGSDDREIPGKLSQTLQLDRERARKLVAIINSVFPST
jgi:hypothetical protein